MPKIDPCSVPAQKGTGYPVEFRSVSMGRLRQRLGAAGGLAAFGINLTRLPPGNWSSQRHWHSHEDEFVYLLEGELVLVEDEGESLLCAGDCAVFPRGTGNGHHMINRSDRDAVYLEIGSHHPDDRTTCSDVDMMSANSDGRFVYKNGVPYSNER